MNRHRLTRSVALGLALAALAAPAAGARPAQDPDAAEASGPAQDIRMPDSRDYAAGRGTYNSPDVIVVEAEPQSQAAPADGLDWVDAGIGAGSLLGLSLIGLGGGLYVAHRRRTAPTAGPLASA